MFSPPSRLSATRWAVLPVLLAVAFALWTAAPASACPSMQFIGVRGSGEHSGFGRTVGSVLSNVNAQQSGVGNQTVNYWAVDVRPWEPKWFPNYVNSVKQGVTNLGNAVDHFRAACAGHPIVLAGYSQGAEVIDHYLRSGRNRGGVVGVALLGDPRFTPANGQPVNQGTYNRRLDGVSPSYFLRVGQFGGSERYPTDRRNWLRSYCANGDQICNTSSMVALTLCHERFNCAHMHYPDLRIGGVAYTRSAANFLLGRARRAMPGTSTPPTNDTQEPTSDNPPSTQQDPASASGVSETVGGAANTWTNYTNAGGAQGPTIPTGTTVTIACKVPGFRVADGNTWWYRIASAPWNGTYYASADAFYNNGATSGSLAGTPFVDPAVPDC